MSEEMTCTMCHCIVNEDEVTEFDDACLCDDCRDEHTTTCDHCGEMIWASDSVCDDHMTLCQDCYDDHYRRCENCGQLIHDNDVYWSGDYPYCCHCYEQIGNEIEDYSYKPEPIFYGDGNRFFGVELEVDCGGKDDDSAEQIKAQTNIRCEHIYIKSDGSLDDGFEIVTHPMTLQYHMNCMDWPDVLRKAIHLGYKSHMTSTCGLHVHVNRNSLGDTEEEQERVIEKILFFTELHWNELFVFSRRSEYSMNRWAARYGVEKTGREILDKAKKGSKGRYAAINLCPYKTVEFRLFRGTLKLNTLLATLQMVNAICDVAVFMSERAIADMSWRDFVMKLKEPELVQYLKERRLYVNDEINCEEDL